MTERTFLEDVGCRYSVTPIGNAKAWEIQNLRNDPLIPPIIYVIESELGERFLLGREVCGRPKFNMIRYIGKSFVELFFERLNKKNCAQYIILKNAYPLDLQYAFGFAPPFDKFLLPTTFISIKKVLDKEGKDWEIQDQNLIGGYQGDTWLIPKTTVASGLAIASFLRNVFTKYLPKEVYLITACGSLEGCKRIYHECLQKGVKFIPVFSQCIFSISKVKNSSDLPLTNLSILNSDSITTRQFYEKAMLRYQGKQMCSVGNLVESLDHPIQYSIHTLWEMQSLGMDPKKENWDAWTINVREKDFQKKVSDFSYSLYEYFHGIWE